MLVLGLDFDSKGDTQQRNEASPSLHCMSGGVSGYEANLDCEIPIDLTQLIKKEEKSWSLNLEMELT